MLWVEGVGWRRSKEFLARNFSEETGDRRKERKKRQKRKKGGLWKLTPLMEIRPERGFPQWLGKHNPLPTVSTRPYDDGISILNLESGHFTCYKKRTSSRANDMR
jgi:hypothetical protein